jgi:hypothetical protein
MSLRRVKRGQQALLRFLPARGERKYSIRVLWALLTFVSVVFLAAQGNHTTAFTGTWDLDKARSSFKPGPAPKSVTITNAPDGLFTAASVDAQGRSIRWSYPWSNGKEVPIDGIKNATMLSTVRGDTLDGTMKIAGAIAETVHSVVSPDGKIMTTTIHSLENHPMGSTHNVLVLQKQ